MANNVRIETKALRQRIEHEPADRDRFVMQNVTGRIFLEGAHGPVAFTVHIYGNHRAEHALPANQRERNEYLEKIKAAAEAALTGAEIDRTQSVRMNFSRTRRRDGGEPPRFQFQQISRREPGNVAELPIETRANAAFMNTMSHNDGLCAVLTKHENKHLQSLRNSPSPQPNAGNSQRSSNLSENDNSASGSNGQHSGSPAKKPKKQTPSRSNENGQGPQAQPEAYERNGVRIEPTPSVQEAARKRVPEQRELDESNADEGRVIGRLSLVDDANGLGMSAMAAKAAQKEDEAREAERREREDVARARATNARQSVSVARDESKHQASNKLPSTLSTDPAVVANEDLP